MSEITTATASPISAPGAELHGEIITWSMGGVAVTLGELRAALEANGLTTAVVRDMLPRHAFSRACRKLADRRIIRRVDEDEQVIHFQFTQEVRVGDGYEYNRETILTLSKADGAITCDLEALAVAAEEALDAAMGVRTASDVTQAIQRLFAREADLFSIREQGGCYFVPQRHAEFVARIEGFVARLGGRIGRFPVPKGTAQGDRSVKASVAEGMEGMIRDHMEAIEGFDATTRESTFAKTAERIRNTRHKLLSYAEYLGAERDRLEAVVADAAGLLRARVELIAVEKEAVKAAGTPAPEPAPVAGPEMAFDESPVAYEESFAEFESAVA